MEAYYYDLGLGAIPTDTQSLLLSTKPGWLLAV